VIALILQNFISLLRIDRIELVDFNYFLAFLPDALIETRKHHRKDLACAGSITLYYLFILACFDNEGATVALAIFHFRIIHDHGVCIDWGAHVKYHLILLNFGASHNLVSCVQVVYIFTSSYLCFCFNNLVLILIISSHSCLLQFDPQSRLLPLQFNPLLLILPHLLPKLLVYLDNDFGLVTSTTDIFLHFQEFISR
jgi:hypothetical protein